jgi:uncharacterized repeat protein (TIGR01451 family)
MRNLKFTALMRNRFFKIGAGLAALAALFLSSAAAQSPALKPLAGHVPAMVSRLSAKGLLPATNSLSLAIGLPLRNQEALTNLLQQIYDPASPNYHHYLTPDEFTAQFGPTEADYQNVINFARANGLTVTKTHGNRMLVNVTGKVSDIQKAFHVTLRTYQHPAESRDFFAPDAEPTVDSSVPVLHVSGLDNYQVPKPLLHKMPASKAAPALGSGPSGTYIGYDFRNAYVPGTTLNGSGQKVGLLEFASGFLQSDITAYEALAGLPNVPVQPVLLDGYGGGLGNAPDEVSLDIEMAISMAPGQSQVLVYEGENTDTILNAMVANTQVKQFGASWSYPIDGTSEQIFKEFAAQGQSFFNASGDFDSWAGIGSIFPPCDDPYITIVGGTTLSTVNSAWSAETVWNWGIEFGDDGIGSGGGISSTYAIPSWQTNVSMTANRGSTTFRNIPDVALTADNIWVIYSGGSSGSFGGTSCATPLWAAFMALVNQQAVAVSRPTIGFINPAVYAIGESNIYASCFHDTRTGNNTWSQSPNLFFAVRGYDLCTGWGTPTGTNLINALVGAVPVQVSAPPPPYGTALNALNGGNPNGTWNFFEFDDGVFDYGEITNGWILALTTANPVGSAADNAVSMTATAGNISVGNNGVYFLTVTNYGPSPATNVLVQDNLPAGANFVSAAPTLGSVTRAGNTLNWSVGVLNGGGQFVLATNAGGQLTVTVQPSASGALINSAFVTANTPDPNPDDASAQATLNAIIATPPQFSGPPTVSGSNFVFSVTNSVAGQTNVVQSSTNLVNWISIYTNVGSFTFTNTIDPHYPSRFYRDLITGP